MKTTILLITALIIGTQATKAQVLYSENFDNLTLGNVGTDFTGATPGKGGWHTKSHIVQTPSQNSNNYFNIVNESGRGKVLALSASTVVGEFYLQKRGIDALWANRNPNNNILKIELDFYTGDQFSDGGSTTPFQGALVTLSDTEVFNATNNDIICNFGYNPKEEFYTRYTRNTVCNDIIDSSDDSLKLKTWIKIIFYLDYSNKEMYYMIPSKNFIRRCDLDNTNVILNALLLKSSNWIGSQATTPVYKYDNIVISAVNTVPLSTQDFLSEKFQVFPNPATDLVNITNNENIAIKQIKIFDTAGKLVKTETYMNQTKIQVNTSILASGSYLFHIETTEGTAVKTIIKK